MPPRPPPSQGISCVHRHRVSEQRFAYDVEWKILGPMPVQEFLNEFFPIPPGSVGTETELSENGVEYDKINFASIPDSLNREDEMCGGLCHELNMIAQARGFIFCNAHEYTEGLGVAGTVKPDIGLFRIEDKHRGHLFNIKKSSGNKPSSYVARMGLAHVFIGAKNNANQDIFADPPLDPPPNWKFTVDTWNEDKDAQSRISALGQNAHYAHLVQIFQFRTCTFSLTISGSTARIMRWDRSGVLVTEAFDYKAAPQTLIEFVWRFINAKPVQQGSDPTAKFTDSAMDLKAFLEAITSHVRLQLALGPETPEKDLEEEVNKHYSDRVLTCLTIGNRCVWVSRPMWVSHAIVGHCTVGYWGVLCDTKEVVFVKDIWRTNVEGVELEGDILSRLKKKGVRQIPTAICHGDVPCEGTDMLLQTTRTDEFTERPWVKSLHPKEPRLRKITPRIHYRLVTNTAGYPLSTFKGSRELLKSTYDCYTAVMDAYEKAQTLHRDVGLPNMIMYRPGVGERAGYLVDWELGCTLDKSAVHDHVLIGTPAFMSIEALLATNHVHGLKDDLESFIYVVLYAALRWLPVESSGRIHWWLSKFFGAPDQNGFGGGPAEKLFNAVHRSYTSNLHSTESAQVVQWLNDAMNLHYKGQVANPLWDDGKALKEMWERCLAGNLPLNDRRINPVDGMRFHEDCSLGATHTVNTSATHPYSSHDESPKPTKSVPIKRLRGEEDIDLHTAPQSKKRSRP